MGGDGSLLHVSYTDDSEESSLHQDFPVRSLGSHIFSGDPLGAEVESNGETGIEFGEYEELSCPISSKNLVDEANRKRAHNIYMEVLRSYDELQHRAESLEDAKCKILSYTPGSWIEGAGATKLSDYDVPETTTILLIGTEGSGKSTLVNKISEVFEGESFTSQRAQVSFNPSIGGGTCFLQEYMIPRSSKSFCLYDTRSLSDDSYENDKMLEDWMTIGVVNGMPIMRFSDDVSLKSRMRRKAYSNIVARPVNFVAFVVNAISVLESMECQDERMKSYTQIVSRAFNNPFLSFKDDRPVVIVTHGDLLPLSDRVRVRVHLGELLGIHPKKQIFDIPESNDSGTKLAILDLLHYCLDHADKNLPWKDKFSSEVRIKHADKSLPRHKQSWDKIHAVFIILLVNLHLLVLTNIHRTASNSSSVPDIHRVHHSVCDSSPRPDAHNFQQATNDSSTPDAHDFQHAAKDSSTPNAHNFQHASKDSLTPDAHDFQHTATDSSTPNANNFQHAGKDSTAPYAPKFKHVA